MLSAAKYAGFHHRYANSPGVISHTLMLTLECEIFLWCRSQLQERAK